MEGSNGRIRIYAGLDGQILVKMPFSHRRVAKIKTIAGRRWDSDVRCWALPGSEETLVRLATVFQGDGVEFDPSLRKPDGERLPGVEILARMAQELRLRGYRQKTRKAYLGHTERFLQQIGKPAGKLDEDDVRDYVYSMLKAGTSHAYASQCVSALKFLFEKNTQARAVERERPSTEKGTEAA